MFVYINDKQQVGVVICLIDQSIRNTCLSAKTIRIILLF